jgi:DNA-binding CsgD family transcriptional regulator
MLRTQLVSPALVGRHEELKALETLLTAAQNGRGAMALVGGDAGVGKTRLCRELKTIAALRQVRVIEGRSSAAETVVPYGPFMDALRFRLARGEGDAAAQVLQPILSHVAPLFAALSENSATESAPTATAAPFEPIFSVLSRLGALGPVLFILEDIHWADATSRDLLHYIARRVNGLPMLVVVTYRTDEVHGGHPAHSLVAALSRERAALRVQLELLPEAEVEHMLSALLGTTPAPDFVRAIFERTEGNPLFIEEHVGDLLRTHSETTGPLRASDLAATAPATLHEIVWERLAPLSSDAREALTAAAVIGRRFRFDVLAAALEWSEERMLSVLEQLVALRMVVESTESGEEWYSFRHSLVQEVIYGAAIGRRRRLWHLRVASALEAAHADGLPHTVLAHHYTRGGDLQKARVHTLLAGDEAARLCAWKDAESTYEAALVLLERAGGDREVEAAILERLADVAWWQDRIGAAEQALNDALGIRRALGEPRRAATLLRRLANIAAYQRADLPRALLLLREALDLLERNAADRVYILNDLGRLHVRQGNWVEAGSLFEEALGASGAHGDCAEEALSLVMLGWLSIQRADIAAGKARLELARALLAEDTLPVERAAEVYHAGIRALEAAREHQSAREWVDAALAFATERGARGDLAVYRAYQAAVQRRAGEWVPATALAANAVAELRLSGRAELREALRILGDLQRGRGELDAARKSYEEAIALGERDAAIGLALLMISEASWQEAANLLATALADRSGDERLFALRVLPLLVEAQAAGAEVEAAEVNLDRLRTLVARSDYRAGRAALAQATGIVKRAAGERTDAVRELGMAITAWKVLDLPFESARASLLLADELVGSQRTRSRGLELAGESARAFEQLGASLELSRAHHVLRRGGLRVRRQRRPVDTLPQPLDQLTARELEVLYEVARGRTNKQIARTLSMSPRTVGNHVSAILAKLSCSTRTEASRLVPTA